MCTAWAKVKNKINNTQILKPQSKANDTTKQIKELMNKRFHKRAGIEPVIDHLK